MDKSKLELYASIKNQIAELEKQAEEIKPEIVASMQAEEADKIETDFGNFVLEKRRTWTFSEDYAVKKDALEELESKEKAEGTATYTEAPVLKFLSKYYVARNQNTSRFSH